MRTRIKNLLLLPVLMVGLGLTESAKGQSGNYNGFEWEQIGNTIEIYGYNGSGGAVAIPSTITNLPVTTIAGFAFYENSSVNSITIPNSSAVWLGLLVAPDVFAWFNARI